jgi:chaperone required for assembly of F1-ATPase
VASEEIGRNGAPGPDLSRIAVREPPPPKAKRFYRDVTVASDGGGHRVLLDARPVRTPLKHVLEAPTLSLARAIADELQAQATEIDPAAMPLTRLAATALDRVALERGAMTDMLLAYVNTDLLCYRASGPATLKARQQAQWQPVTDWLGTAHGIQLAITEGILPIEQPTSAFAAAEAALGKLSVHQLTALQATVGATGSLALGLALTYGYLNAAQVIAAAHLDETYQNEQWGEDAEALARRRRIAAEIEATARYLELIA